ncbi:hypothetical protein ACFPRL_03060 [Pseudoclavibacter helvolus]
MDSFMVGNVPRLRRRPPAEAGGRNFRYQEDMRGHIAGASRQDRNAARSWSSWGEMPCARPS